MAYALLNLGGWSAQRKERSGEGWASGGPPRNSWRRAAALVGPLLAFMAAGCFTGPINHPPTVRIDPLDAPAKRQQPVMLHATAMDSDGDTVHLKWAYVPGDCTPSQPDASSWTVPDPDEASYMVSPDKTDGPFCVWVMATDTHGATGTYSKPVDPEDQQPTIAINVVSPDPVLTKSGDLRYRLYSTIEVSPQVSDPDDKSLPPAKPHLDKSPTGSTAALMPCGPANGSDVCFVADVSGEYDVSFTVMDPSGKPGMNSEQIIVLPDQSPCIGPTDPDFLSSPMVEVTLSSPNQTPDLVPFTIHSVDDDGAPLPSGPKGGPQFRWYISTDMGQTYQFINNDFPMLRLGSTGLYKAGDTVKVRVEVSDRIPANDAKLAGCTDDHDVCENPAGSGCFQRVTWSVDLR